MKKIIILHGWTYSTEKYESMNELLKAKGLRTSMLDIPGFTKKLSTDKIWSLEDYINWLKLILDKEKEKVLLIGHSNGGRIALNFAIKYPQKLSNLILIDSAGIYHNDLAIQLKRLFFGILAKIGKKLTSSEKLRSLLYKMTGEKDYKNASSYMRKTMVNLVRSDMLLNLEKVNVPTLIIWGGRDMTTPLSDGILMNKLIKNSKLEIIKDARHSPHFTNAKEVTEIIYEHI